ncbi:MAG: hypothetical protein V3W37_03165 [Candidatus Binatia bacterium]
MASATLDDTRMRKRLAKMLSSVRGPQARRLLLLIGNRAVRGYRTNVLQEKTPGGKSFKGTLAPSTKNAIKQRETSRTRGVKRKGKKLRTVRGGAHIRRGGGTVLRDSGAMFRGIGIASVRARAVETGMTTKLEAVKAAGHHFDIKPHKGPTREFIGLNRRLWKDILVIAERHTVKAARP